MYGSTGHFEVVGQTVPVGSVVTVDQTDGSGALVGTPVEDLGLSGLVFGPGGDIFASTRVGGGTPGSDLLRVDPDTGALLQNVGAIRQGVDDVGISDLAVQPGTGTIFGISAFDSGIPCAGCLYTIDPATAAASLVGDPGLSTNGGLAFDPDGTLFMTSTVNVGANFDPLFELLTLNPSNAALLTRETYLIADFIICCGGHITIRSVRFDGLAARPSDGTLFATQGGGAREIYRRLTDGTWEFQGNAVGNMTDLAFRPEAATVIPEPRAPLLFTLGTLLVLGAARSAKGALSR